MKAHLQLLRYAGPHWRSLVLVLATMLLTVLVDVLRPWPLKLLVDHVLGAQPVSDTLRAGLDMFPGAASKGGMLAWICVSTVFIFLAGSLLGMLNTFASVGLGQRMTFTLGADLFLHLQRLSLLFHSRRAVGDLMSRVTGDAYCVQTFVTGALIPLLQSLVTLVAMFSIMWNLEPGMTLLSLAVVPFLGVSIRIFGREMKERTRARRNLEGRMMSVVQQTLSAMPAVQAFGREETEYARFREFAEETVAAYQRGTMASMWFKMFVGLVTAVGTAAIMWLGAREVLAGNMSVGSVLVFLSYLASLYAPLQSITSTASTWQGSAANADRVLEILRRSPEIQDAPDAVSPALKGAIRYDRVSFGYEPDRPAVHDASLEVHPGEVLAIVGPTGAGKTTLVSMLVRFYDPSAGSVSIDGIDVRRMRVKSLRAQVAMVLQDPFIFPLTVAENIAYGRPGASRDEIVAAAEAASAHDFISRLPQGYDTVVGERGATLSGGEKQRLSIARAFLKNAPILVLDEPTSALDAATESRLIAALDRLMKGRTTIIIAHRLSTIRRADQIVVLDRGRIVERGRHAELLLAGGLYASLYHHQSDLTRHDTTRGDGEDPARRTTLKG